MPRNARKRYPGAKYHLTNRGNGKQKIFFHEDDYSRFYDQMRDALDKDGVILYAYCLMPNHYHLFVETPLGNIDDFMRRLNTAYAMYFRYKHYRPGHCFQGRYKSPLVEGDDYISRLTRYIHLNPVKTRNTKHLSGSEKYERLLLSPWSSLHGYINRKKEEDIVDYRWLNMFGGKRTYRSAYHKYIRQMLTKDDDVLIEAMQASSYAIGDADFRKHVDDWVYAEASNWSDMSDVELPEKVKPELSSIEDLVEEEFNLEKGELRIPRRRLGAAKGVFIELASIVGGSSQRAISRYLGSISEHAVCKERNKLRTYIADDEALPQRIKNLAAALKSKL